MRSVQLPDGTAVPALGLGTWRMGEKPRQRSAEVRALTAGLDLGLTLIDTAEMYGEGGAEEVVAEAIAGRRGRVFLVTKVYPHNATSKGLPAACERSLKRLKTDRIDLYLLHWRGNVPLAETVEGFERLREAGKIRRWGVSNLDTEEMRTLSELPGGKHCQANQVLYHLEERGAEWSLMPWQRNHGIPTMAYSPLGQGALVQRKELVQLARARAVAPAAVALAWVLRRSDVIAIPKAAQLDHLRENAKAADLVLSDEELAVLDRAFPPPSGPSRLAIV
ncbi:MAG TPA: aldo/keto reductase [Kiloniellales bacterium]|nr:aldo/keto reductase [Kiloniellales bacterium]